MRRADESGEERVWREWLRLKLRMELAAEEPRMVGQFDDFDVRAIGSFSGDAETGGDENFLVVAIEFIAMAVALADFQFAVRPIRE